MTLEGDSSQPPTSLPSITQSAPIAKALHILPEFLFPPSEMSGTPYCLQIGATSQSAENYMRRKSVRKGVKHLILT